MYLFGINNLMIAPNLIKALAGDVDLVFHWPYLPNCTNPIQGMLKNPQALLQKSRGISPDWACPISDTLIIQIPEDEEPFCVLKCCYVCCYCLLSSYFRGWFWTFVQKSLKYPMSRNWHWCHGTLCPVPEHTNFFEVLCFSIHQHISTHFSGLLESALYNICCKSARK